MVRKGIIERRNEKSKPRGKPFPKDNVRGKPKSKAMADSGRRSCVERGIIDTKIEDETINESRESMTTPAEIVTIGPGITLNSIKVEPMEESKELELMESLEFTNGPNKLSIRFSKKHNRMYRIQVFLNDETEIRPVTYSGASTGVSFWNLLKGVLKK